MTLEELKWYFTYARSYMTDEQFEDWVDKFWTNYSNKGGNI